MADLISIDAAMELFDWWEHEYEEIDNYIRNMRQDVLTLPTIEAEPVKHAHVIRDEDGNIECSNCGSGNCFDNYCGHCGAKLIGSRKDGGENDRT